MDAHPASIRTPDQRIRVFLSSTLRELEPEREAARAAIESLHLAPVMFELGARPHPPRSLYRAYLAQSDIFVGHVLAALRMGRPRREGLGPRGRIPAVRPAAAPHLHQAARARARAAPGRTARPHPRRRHAAPTSGFETPAELREPAHRRHRDAPGRPLRRVARSRRRGEAAGSGARHPRAVHARSSAAPTSSSELLELLGTPGVRIVTHRRSRRHRKVPARDRGRERCGAAGREVAFAALETIDLARSGRSARSRAPLGVRETGEERVETKLITALAGRDMLLVVDNMEHLLDATGDPGAPDHRAAAPAAARHQPLAAARPRRAHIRARPADPARARCPRRRMPRRRAPWRCSSSAPWRSIPRSG